jgi:hypothetical protein
MGQSKAKKVLVGVPVYRDITQRTVISLLQLSQRFQNIDFHIQSGCYIEHSRNSIANLAVQRGYDRLLFVDGDVSFGTKDYSRLVMALDEDPEMGMVCGIYSTWSGDNLIVAGWMNDDGSMWLEADCQKYAKDLIRKQEVHPIDKAGAGFMLIDVDVFRKIPPLWFMNMTEMGELAGEDFYFIQLLKHNGYKPSGHFGVVCGHTGPTVHFPNLDEEEANEPSNEVSK